MGLLEICCEKQPSDCFEIVTFAGLAEAQIANQLGTSPAEVRRATTEFQETG